MTLKELIKNIRPESITGDTGIEIKGVNIDSRRIADGHLFVAMKGTQVDGHAFIAKAISQGAAAILCEDMPEETSDSVTYVQVKSTEDAVGEVATQFYGDPSRKLKLVGVTGTNGKTTIATLLYNMFRKLGYKCGLLSTVCNYIEDERIPTTHTTPDPIELNQLLSRMVEAGCQYAFMECSSHAIAQKRIGGLKFAGGIFTNLTRDHLDYHKTFENYRNAKKPQRQEGLLRRPAQRLFRHNQRRRQERHGDGAEHQGHGQDLLNAAHGRLPRQNLRVPLRRHVP